MIGASFIDIGHSGVDGAGEKSLPNGPSTVFMENMELSIKAGTFIIEASPIIDDLLSFTLIIIVFI